MSDTAVFVRNPSLANLPSATRIGSLLCLAFLIILTPMTGILSSDWNAGLTVAGISLLVVAICVAIKVHMANVTAQNNVAVMSAFAEHQDAPFVVANTFGEVLTANARAKKRFGAVQGIPLTLCLRSTFSNPQAVLLRLQSQVQSNGRAFEEFPNGGNILSVTAFRLSADVFCWRFQEGEAAVNAELSIPVLTIGYRGEIQHANLAATRMFGNAPNNIQDIFCGEAPVNGSVNTVRSRDGVVSVAVADLSQTGTKRCLGLVPLLKPAVSEAGTSFADLPVPILNLSTDGTILDTNRLAARLLGKDTLKGTNIDQVMRGLRIPIPDWLARTASEEDVQRTEFLQLIRGEKEVFVQVTLSKVVSDGKAGLIAVLNDATELKTLEAQFVQGQKMQAVGQLAGGVAHDFNNLLTAISGHCDLLLLRHDQNDPDYGDLVQINQNANRAAALVSQLLAFSRKQTLRPEVLDLRDTISDLIHLLNRLVGEKVQLTLSHDPVLKPVRADKRQLEQVLMNLVVNARDAMADGGEIRIETEVVNLSQPFSRDRATVQPGEYVTVRVVDSGTGIPADKLQKVFEPFYTTKRTGEGTGLGLSTVYGIVKQTGGFIFVDSVVGRGTEFTVFLPVCVTAAEVEVDAPKQPETHYARQGEGVVLLVEDEAPVRAFATRALRLKGYTVLEADSAEEALKLLEDPALNVDVFVTDVVMPGMDGPTWVREAQKTRPDARVVFVSGYTEGAFGDSGPDIANSTFLPKPFSLNQLTEAVFQQLN
ncbi:ATP-binding protein [Ruegeria sp. 6PALISEP08]|uniref:ATP-binding protein n=1 Tax=Ruegeria sp. 6PALISEP08 TaxID=1225660 RepID=UPI00067F6F2D|nr:ATP-binding protein [Ruegeria sp. 6PALISEP08]